MDVAVIGAGQAGLAVAFHLRDLGARLAVLDAGPTAGGAWQHRWPSLTLGRTHRLADLPGMRELGLSFDDVPSGLPARDAVPGVLAQYERAYGLPVARPVRVTRVTRTQGVFLLEAAPGSEVPVLESRVVVSATGTWTRPRQPVVPGIDMFQGSQLTTPEYPGAGAFAGMRVAVIGGGLSALGFMDELAGTASEIRWYTRRPPQIIEDASSELGLARGRAAVAAQDAAASAGLPLPSIVSATGIPLTPPVRRLRARGLLHAHPMPVRLSPVGLVSADGTTWEADAIIWAIGFEPALDHLRPLGVPGTGGGLRVDKGRVAGMPGLMLAGYAGQASTISASRAARATAAFARAYLAGSTDWPV
ncbi:NAD(P)/FAD-dependent oxidoreductase [Demequina capsici]|uniref:NAD(P)/FAD-dependent oxidoreductase n=1 Tax=Demequina capsici TaxID=3075620 RepID=A0AA96FI14_9MICO|nr:NAD(P)/FAD-dependent oxidoreductase [Demequina sp. PMTSA13]WNM28721.1 NAD(P)/FAD-dependent oxidoreductase [Demequina sp. PMTSA13]